MGAPIAVEDHGVNITVRCDQGLRWTLSMLDPSWSRQLRRLVGEVYSRDRRYADLIVAQLPAVWLEGFHRGWAA